MIDQMVSYGSSYHMENPWLIGNVIMVTIVLKYSDTI